MRMLLGPFGQLFSRLQGNRRAEDGRDGDDGIRRDRNGLVRRRAEQHGRDHGIPGLDPGVLQGCAAA